ncbi:MAG: cell division ATP-binding protein FtsE [Ignavibacteria bacterium]
MIKIDSLSFSYDGKEIFADASATIQKGDFVFLVGETGIGKTTLLRLIYLDLFPKKGKIIFNSFNSSTIDKKEIPHLRRQIGIVFQDFKLMNDRPVFDNIATPLYITGHRKEEINKRVFQVASELGISSHLKEIPYDLSGGEQQRVAIARAIVNNPPLLIADEPTGNLDPFVGANIIKLLLEINSRGTTAIIATHNFEIVRRHSEKRILQIKDKKLYDVRIKSSSQSF